MQASHTPTYFKLAITFIFSYLLFSISALAQGMATVPRPDWVKDIPIPYEDIDSIKIHKKSQGMFYLGGSERELYSEVQINVDTEEFFERSVNKLTGNRTNFTHKIELGYPSKDVDRKIVGVTVRDESGEREMTKKINWTEFESKEYVFSRLWESYNAVELSLDQLDSGDMYTLSVLDKSIREDSRLDEGILYSCVDSMLVYTRIISSKPLHYKCFNGYPELVVTQHADYYEYVASGLAVSPYKDITPNDFLEFPFFCLSKYNQLEEVGTAFKSQFLVDEESAVLLDELTNRLTENEPNDSAKVQHILNYVQDTMIYQDYGLIRAYQPSWCIQGNRGDCKAKTLITIAMLNRIGIEAQPVLVNAPTYLEQLDSLPSGYSFNHVIVQFWMNGQSILVDPTATQQTDKVGHYPVPAYGKALVMYEDKTEVIDIAARNQGKIEVYDEISSNVKRKVILTGEYAEYHANSTSRGSQDESVFVSKFMSNSIPNFALHKLNFAYRSELDKSDLEENIYNTILQDSVVLSQEGVYPDSVNMDLIPATARKPFKYNPNDGFKGPQLDSLYTGLWDLEYINQVTEAKYFKTEIPLQKVDLSEIDKTYTLEEDFGYYRCTVEENETSITVKQEIYVSGSLPSDRMKEHTAFKEQVDTHQTALRNLLLAKSKLPKSIQKKLKKRNKKYDKMAKKRSKKGKE